MPQSLVVGVGLVTADLVQRIDHLPGPNQKIWARDATLTFGGPAANAVATAVHLGCQGRLVAPVGSGPMAEAGLGALVTAELARAGVELVDIAGEGFTPPISSVLVTEGTGERAVVSVNARWAARNLPVAAGMLSGAQVLLVDGHLMGHQHAAARLARRLGILVIQDAGSWKPGGIPYLTSLTDLTIVSADFVVPGLGPGASGREVLDWLAMAGTRWAVRTQGAGPVQVRWADGQYEELPVPPVAAVVDTLGAGDVFHGAVAAALAEVLAQARVLVEVPEPPSSGAELLTELPRSGVNLPDTTIRAALLAGIAAARDSITRVGLPRKGQPKRV